MHNKQLVSILDMSFLEIERRNVLKLIELSNILPEYIMNIDEIMVFQWNLQQILKNGYYQNMIIGIVMFLMKKTHNAVTHQRGLCCMVRRSHDATVLVYNRP